MNKPILLLAITATLVTNITAQVGAIDPNGPQMQHEHAQQHEVMQKYTCPMHPEVITDHPGNCPKCGMKLVPLKEKKRRTSNIQRSTSNIVQPETHSSHLSHPSDPTHHEGNGNGNALHHRSRRPYEPRRVWN